MDDDALSALLQQIRTIAVIGIKNGESDDAFRVPRYLQAQGYRILPVNPKLEEVLGERCHAALGDCGEPIDLVDVFRAPRFVAAHVDEILELPTLPRCVWLQLGISDETSAQRLREAGVQVVQDRCLMVDHRRVLGAGEEAP